MLEEKEKRYFLSSWKRCHDAQITWPYAYYVTLGSHCKMGNSSSEDETDTLPKRPTRIQPYQFEPAGFWKSTRTSCQLRHVVFHGVCKIVLSEVLDTQMGMMQRSKKVSSFELYKLNALLPHCGSIAWELVLWGHLRIVTVCGNTVGRHFCQPHTYTVYWRI